MMDAKMGKSSSIYENVNRKNKMQINQEKVKEKIARMNNIQNETS